MTKTEKVFVDEIVRSTKKGVPRRVGVGLVYVSFFPLFFLSFFLSFLSLLGGSWVSVSVSV